MNTTGTTVFSALAWRRAFALATAYGHEWPCAVAAYRVIQGDDAMHATCAWGRAAMLNSAV